MSRRAAKLDSNQKAIQEALEAAGCTFLSLAGLGQGAPDAAVGRAGVTYMLEIKSAKGRLRDKQAKFRSQWTGHYAIVRTTDEALAAVGLRFGVYDDKRPMEWVQIRNEWLAGD